MLDKRRREKETKEALTCMFESPIDTRIFLHRCFPLKLWNTKIPLHLKFIYEVGGAPLLSPLRNETERRVSRYHCIMNASRDEIDIDVSMSSSMSEEEHALKQAIQERISKLNFCFPSAVSSDGTAERRRGNMEVHAAASRWDFPTLLCRRSNAV